MQREQIANGVFLNTLPAEKFNRCRMSIHFRFPASRELATNHALLPLVLERGYADCPDMTQLSRKLAKLYGAALTVETGIQGASRVISVSISGIKDCFALEGENLSNEYASILLGVAFDPYFENGMFSEEAVRIEKQTLARQLESEINDKRLYCIRQARRRFFENSPAGIEREGYLADLPAVTSQTLTDAYRKMLKEATIDVMVLGTDSEAIRDALLQKLNALDRAPADLPGNLFMPRQETLYFEEKMELVQAKLCMMFTLNQPANPEDLNAFRMAMSVFGGSSTSRLFLNVREKQSLCYYCGSRFNSASGCMIVDSGVEPANVKKAEAAILAELDQLIEGEITRDELEDARRGLLSAMTSVEDSLSGIENWYLGEIMRGAKIHTPEESAQQLMAVTEEDVRRLLKKFSLSVSYLVTAKEGDNNEN